MRVDYFHAGSATEESFALDGVALEGAWPGTARRAASTTLTWANTSSRWWTASTNRLLYSRGFASVYGEWETTDEAKQQRRASSASPCAFPAPAGPVQIVLKKRGRAMIFRKCGR